MNISEQEFQRIEKIISMLFIKYGQDKVEYVFNYFHKKPRGRPRGEGESDFDKLLSMKSIIDEGQADNAWKAATIISSRYSPKNQSDISTSKRLCVKYPLFINFFDLVNALFVKEECMNIYVTISGGEGRGEEQKMVEFLRDLWAKWYHQELALFPLQLKSSILEQHIRFGRENICSKGKT